MCIIERVLRALAREMAYERELLDMREANYAPYQKLGCASWDTERVKVEARVIGGCSLACLSTQDGLRETGLTRNAIAFEHERRTVS